MFQSTLPPPLHAHTAAHYPPMVVSEAVLRRRSADVGGLHLAMRGESQGQGWLDSTGSDTNIATEYAELCATMYRETLRLVENNIAQNDPPTLSQEDRVRLLKSLESWYFEPLRMPEHELLACVLFLFQALFRIQGMKDAIKVDMDVIPRFILHIRQLYRWQNHYHNFEHAVDVLQAIHCYLRAAGMVPPVSVLLVDADAPGGMWSSTREHDSGPLVTCLTPHEIFALYLAAIGHDVGHPGLNNPFMKHAEAPLSQVYDNQSALEQLHGYLLLMAMRHHGLGVLLDDPQTGALFRKILKSSVLATDMGIHQAFMEQFAQILEGTTEAANGIVKWQTSKCGRQVFICQLLLKNADISNPCRPFLVSKQWASALQQEWACQYKFENFLELKHSVSPSNDPLAEAKSQVFFSKHIAKDLVDMTTIAIPELRQYSHHCAENLCQWERILKELQQSQAADEPSSRNPSTTASTIQPSVTSSQPLSSTEPASLIQQNPTLTTSCITSSTQNSNPHALNHASATENPASSQSHISPTPLSMSTSLSTSSSISSSSSNPVSPRIANNDYSTAFRLALPRAKSDGSSFSPIVTPGSIAGSILGSALSLVGANSLGRNKVSRTPSSSGGAMSPGGSVNLGGGVLSPSLSRGAARVVSGGSPSSSSPQTNSPSSRHLHAHVPEDRTQMDGYKFPINFNSPASGPLTPAPPPTGPELITPHINHQPLQSRFHANNNNNFQTQSQSHSSTPSVSPSESRSQTQDLDTDDQQSQGAGGGLESVISDDVEDEYERDVQTHRATFNQAVGLGLGVGSLKKQKSSNVLRSLPFGYSPSPPPAVGGGGINVTSPTSSCAAFSTLPDSVSGSSRGAAFGGGGGGCRKSPGSLQSNPNRASWCGAMEEDWRGRWGSESFAHLMRSGQGGSSRAVAAEESEGEVEGMIERGSLRKPNGTTASTPDTRVGEEEEIEPIPTGLVSAAPFHTPSLSSHDTDPDPQTPPPQTGAFDSENRSGSPTPKAKAKSLTKMRETEEHKKRRLEKEERRAEEEREKIRGELIRQDEKDKLKKKRTMESLRVNSNNSGTSGTSGKGRGKSRSKSKNRKKGTKTT